MPLSILMRSRIFSLSMPAQVFRFGELLPLGTASSTVQPPTALNGVVLHMHIAQVTCCMYDERLHELVTVALSRLCEHIEVDV